MINEAAFEATLNHPDVSPYRSVIAPLLRSWAGGGEKMNKQKMGRRGQDAAGGWTMFGVALTVAIVSFVVLAIMLGALQTSQTANSLPYNISGNGLTFLSNVTGQLGTAGTILGVSLLLVIIAGVGFAGYSAYQKVR